MELIYRTSDEEHQCNFKLHDDLNIVDKQVYRLSKQAQLKLKPLLKNPDRHGDNYLCLGCLRYLNGIKLNFIDNTKEIVLDV